VKLQFSALHGHLTSICSIFFVWEDLKTTASARTFDTMEELWRRIEQFETEIKNTSEISERLQLSFSRGPELGGP
jgi:hypothetical protein